ncbi:murein hydrolase activator EnvC family protein [Kaarinaea lacus]
MREPNKRRYLPSLHAKVTHLFLLVPFLTLFLVTALADNDIEQEKLVKLRQKINTIQKELEADNKAKDQAVYKLKQAEKSIAKQSSQLRSIDLRLQSLQAKRHTLLEQQNELKQNLSTHRDYLTKQMQAAYAMGKQEYIKLLLNQQNPSDISRMVVYYQYLNASRTDRINEITRNLSNLQNINKEIQNKTAELEALKEEAEENRRTLEANRNQRRQIVATLSSQLKDKGQMLKGLLRDEQHLKRLLNQLENELDDVQLDLAPPEDFTSLKGKLPWPTQGKISARFGSSRQAGELKWKGVMIQTKTGNDIRAIAYGRVIFADWLRGFGMLIIVDHGKGYMSLYGHNQQLHKKVGDWVQGNETIATAGDSGGQKISSLYFEIRHNGVPQNPGKWCKPLLSRS